MDLKAEIKQILGVDGQNANVLLTIHNTLQIMPELQALAGQELSVTLKRYHEKRSLNANAYAWVLISKLALVHETSKEELYEELLRKYGVPYQDENGYVTITVKSYVDMSKIGGHWLRIRENGDFTSYMMIKGTSEYDRAEMAKFIDAIVEEAKESGIETLTPDELERMLNEWQRSYGASLPKI